ncbi:twin-arginine translocation pathway signal protein [Altererythrobacter sp. B11]|uniref:sulfatase-like hydrolase/transferase n=1 Tax=Altererythrobacter sp. B11 TaxID=2060312 RepID=UPI000DC72CDA|nr:sulfatase-like hydrolase/transferase [Altererythrobacter sp. B11]BBC74261.1 twin-arginine translocation pathway signal protein [Altererythrobacter sp. B11]
MTERSIASRITRRAAMAGALGTAALAVTVPGLARTPRRRPNFLFIMADDLGYADLSCYGRREYQTPVLDGLAAQGMKFTHGYANSAVCSATRVGLITGRYQYRTPAGLEEPLQNPDLGLDPAHPTLPSLLRQQGYHSALVGKWHMGGLPRFGPLQSGYDEFWGNRGGGVDYFTHAIGGKPDLWDGDVPVEELGYYTDLLADRSLEYLDARAKEPGKPWLLSLHFTAAHWPWETNDAAGRAESARLAQKPPGPDLAIADYDGGTMETYAGMVTSLDTNVGRVLARLRELGMEQDTVVIFTSDNGGERFSDNWPFTGIKTELLEGGIRVPLIVRWPGVTPAGGESTVPAMSMDFLPTFLAAAGGAPDPRYPTDGVDLRPAMAGSSMGERTLFWRFWNKDQKAARRGRYKYLKMGPEEFLFDVVADPLERGNLKDRMPELFAELKAAHASWNSDMLIDPNARSYGFEPWMLADHFKPES